ncbi:MAG: 3-phosphoshikimate 1-carboxyvinyltransferase [Oscillospiraceae bacterium]|nr:3-phosphoshikimate 1-carboxyvinyltransferase [Oscillospiraceae bacterium]
MTVTVWPGRFAGNLTAIASKSHLHRLLICAALSESETTLICGETEALDIKATIACLSALGARIERKQEGFAVMPIDRSRLPKTCVLPCMESGSTLRFMLPVVCALGVSGAFLMEGRLSERPLAPLDAELSRNGIELFKPKPDILCCKGKLRPAHYTLPGNVSSQYISGLLMALPLLDFDSVLHIEEPIESEGYIDMTLEANAAFKQQAEPDDGDFIIRGGRIFESPGTIVVEGDWSNGAFWLCAGAMPGGAVRLNGLNKKSSQGDREICDILGAIGANISCENGVFSASEAERRAVEIDARAIPDLIPVLSAVAAVGDGTTFVRNAGRLRLKESDRLLTTAQLLNTLGAKVVQEQDGLRIDGVKRLTGGVVDACGDHRIAMTAAVASAACSTPVVITGAQAVNKSYPQFWEKLKVLGKKVEIEC